MWFDSHCHLHLCEGSASEVLERAREAGVTELLTVGIDLASSRAGVELATTEQLWAACGVHPNDCAGFDDADALELEEMLGRERVVAAGETGLDFYRQGVDPDTQRRVFGVHIELAKRHSKALVIHTRDSVEEAMDVLGAAGSPSRSVFHCWSGTPDQLKRAVDLGSFISFAGNVSFKSARDLREAAAIVPDDRILVETDSPFLSPEPHRGKTNEPARVADVGVAVAAARGVPVSDLALQTAVNARRLFGLA